MKVSLYDYHLPEDRIAQKPVYPRDSARLLVYDVVTGKEADRSFFELPDLLRRGDVLVLNDTKVTPVRLKIGEKRNKEIFFIRKEGDEWWVMMKPAKSFRMGVEYAFEELKFEVCGVSEEGFRRIRVNLGDLQLQEFLRKYAEFPIPPYIRGRDFSMDEYNTVFSVKTGSVAAPTAGLHFTPKLLDKLVASGIILEKITLDVGLGTFLPVKVEDTDDHRMHSEFYEISAGTAGHLNRYIAEGRRIIAVGTTVVRTLEDNFSRFGKIAAGNFSTDIFIQPGYKWKLMDGMITNFHLPKSTLLMLVSAYAGREKVLELYQGAVERGYRFFSFGDAMLLTGGGRGGK